MKVRNAFGKSDNYNWCIASGKCSLITNNADFNIIKALSFILQRRKVLDNPPYSSPLLDTAQVGYIMSKSLPKYQRDRVTSYTSRSFEMGLEKKKSFASEAFAIKLVQAFTRMNPSAECFSKEIKTSVTKPSALNKRYFEKCYHLYLLVAGSALMLHFFSFMRNTQCTESRNLTH